jgi:nucleoside-diphosphate-sugar epimerase
MLLHQQLLEQALDYPRRLHDNLKDKAVLITGASGFLASSMIVFLTKLNKTFSLNLDLYAAARRRSDEVDLFRFMNCVPPQKWAISSVNETAIPNVPGIIIVHAASFGSPKDYQKHPLETFEANTAGLLNLFARSSEVKASQLMYISSAEIYGQPPTDEIPTREDYVGGLPTLEARSIYGESKRMGEVLGTCLAESTRIPLTVVRPWNVYGPGQRLEDGRVPIEFMRQGLLHESIRLASNGTPRRAFCHAWTAVRQIVGLLGHDEASGAWNVGCGKEEVSILEAAKQCAAACDLGEDAVSVNARAGSVGVQRSAPDTRKIDAVVGVNPAVKLEQGLKTVREWIEFITRP